MVFFLGFIRVPLKGSNRDVQGVRGSGFRALWLGFRVVSFRLFFGDASCAIEAYPSVRKASEELEAQRA